MIIIVVVVVGLLIFMNRGPRYNVHYDNVFYKNAKDSYRVGQKVSIYYNLIATDTDYRFNVEGADYEISYNDRKGYVIEFVMPANDVYVSMSSKNSMIYEGPIRLYQFKYEVYTEEGREYEHYIIEDYDYKLTATQYKNSGEYDFEFDESGISEIEALIQSYDPINWENEDCLEGVFYAFEFYVDHHLYSITSDQMSSDGESFFVQLLNIIRSKLI